MSIETAVTEELVMLHRPSGQEIDIDSLQGLWTVEQYLKLTNAAKHLIEYSDGYIEVLQMPTRYHQKLVRFLFLALMEVMERIGGDVYFAPLRVQVRQGKFREPDLLLVLDKDDPRARDEYWTGADLVMEIVSPDDPKRDIEQKPLDYAAAGIPEYWIVNPIDATISVLVLDGVVYTVAGAYTRGERASSPLLDGFSVSVDEVFDAR
jgi:Uma2 family endonuclease